MRPTFAHTTYETESEDSPPRREEVPCARSRVHSSMDDRNGPINTAPMIARLAEGRRAVSATQAHGCHETSAANAAARAVKAVAPANARPRRGDS